MSLLDQLAQLGSNAAAQTTVRIETTLLPTITLNLAEQLAAGEGPGTLTKLLRPKVTVITGGQTLVTSAPAGDPKDADLTPLLFGVGLVVLGFVAWRVMR